MCTAFFYVHTNAGVRMDTRCPTMSAGHPITRTAGLRLGQRGLKPTYELIGRSLICIQNTRLRVSFWLANVEAFASIFEWSHIRLK